MPNSIEMWQIRRTYFIKCYLKIRENSDFQNINEFKIYTLYKFEIILFFALFQIS